MLRHIYTTTVSSTFTSSSWTIQTFSAFFSHPLEEADSADGSVASDQKSATFVLKLSRRPGREWGVGGVSQTRDDREFK